MDRDAEDLILTVDDLEVCYGPFRALLGVSLEVPRGSMVALLGPNGAGKSTFGRAMAGLIPVSAGRIDFNGQDVTRWPAHRLRRAGVAYIPEGRGVFPGLTVLDNLKMAVQQVQDKGERAKAVARAVDMFPVLGRRLKQRSGSMSGGEQQMLALARALVVDPKLIIADEMSLGLAPFVIDSVFEALQKACRLGVSIVIIEQFIHRALAMSDYAAILARGEVSWSGPARGGSQESIARYLGVVPDQMARGNSSHRHGVLR